MTNNRSGNGIKKQDKIIKKYEHSSWFTWSIYILNKHSSFLKAINFNNTNRYFSEKSPGDLTVRKLL